VIWRALFTHHEDHGRARLLRELIESNDKTSLKLSVCCAFSDWFCRRAIRLSADSTLDSRLTVLTISRHRAHRWEDVPVIAVGVASADERCG
jgi:hypothetical protein